MLERREPEAGGRGCTNRSEVAGCSLPQVKSFRGERRAPSSGAGFSCFMIVSLEKLLCEVA